LSGGALKVPGGGVGWWVASYPLSSQAPTPVEVELGCDNKLTKLPIVFNNFSNNTFKKRGDI
jgi:hypothetical protein